MRRWMAVVVMIGVFVGTVGVYRATLPDVPARPPPQSALRPLCSPVFKAIGYSEGTRTLQLAFHDGAVYEYEGVSPACFETLLQSQRRGAYFNSEIRGRFPCRKITIER
jgi:hypothetical protein